MMKSTYDDDPRFFSLLKQRTCISSSFLFLVYVCVCVSFHSKKLNKKKIYENKILKDLFGCYANIDEKKITKQIF